MQIRVYWKTWGAVFISLNHMLWDCQAISAAHRWGISVKESIVLRSTAGELSLPLVSLSLFIIRLSLGHFTSQWMTSVFQAVCKVKASHLAMLWQDDHRSH